MAKSAKPVNADDALDAIGLRIVEAAARAFTEQGFAGASTRSIACAAKTSKREIYDRFFSKDELFKVVMGHLCALGAAGERQEASEATDIAGELQVIAAAVLARFTLPETRGVLAAAVGAIPTSPSVIRIFWDEGPGQAVDAVITVLRKRHASGEIPRLRYRELATRFIHDSCGPIVLRQLFDETFKPGRTRIDRTIAAAVRNLEESIDNVR